MLMSKLGLQQWSIPIYAATTSQERLSKEPDWAQGPPGNARMSSNHGKSAYRMSQEPLLGLDQC